MFAKNLAEVLSAVRGHFPSNDGSDNFCYYSCDCIDLSRVSPAVILSLQCEQMFPLWTRSVQLSEKYRAVRVMVSNNRWVTLSEIHKSRTIIVYNSSCRKAIFRQFISDLSKIERNSVRDFCSFAMKLMVLMDLFDVSCAKMPGPLVLIAVKRLYISCYFMLQYYRRIIDSLK